MDLASAAAVAIMVTGVGVWWLFADYTVEAGVSPSPSEQELVSVPRPSTPRLHLDPWIGV